MIENLGFRPKIQKSTQPNGKIKYVIRISRDTKNFIKCINLWKE